MSIVIIISQTHTPRERDSNENLNGLVKQYLPKRTDFNILLEEKILDIQNKSSARPRKRYNFESPILQMEKLLFNSEVAFVS